MHCGNVSGNRKVLAWTLGKMYPIDSLQSFRAIYYPSRSASWHASKASSVQQIKVLAWLYGFNMLREHAYLHN